MADFFHYTERLRLQIKRTWIILKLHLQQFRKDHPRLIKAAKYTTVAGVIGMVMVFSLIAAVYLGFFGPLPTYAELRDIQNNTASEVYSEDGVLLGKYFVENRINADFEEIPINLINALIATEDARFFEHSGVDFRAWLRVFVKSILLFDRSSGGGSTLSQQLAKNLYPRKDYSILTTPVNKIRETFVASRLEKTYAKEELLNLYLNTVPFGENVYGIKVAAQRFFSKSPEDLRTEEAAVLVGMLKANTYYNPVRHPERAQQRRNVVLSQMAKYDYLEQSVADSLQELPLEVHYQRDGNSRGLATYFREHLRQELEEILADMRKPDGSGYNIYTDGLKVFTTIDARMQRYAEEAAQEHMSKLQATFDKHWAKGSPWGSDDVLQQAIRQTQRYQQLKSAGRSEAEIREIFESPVTMVIFDWEEDEVVRKMSPLDSVKYYLSLLNMGLLAIEPQTGLVRSWVGGINHKYFQYDHVKSHRQVGSTFKPIVFAQALENGMLPCEYTENKLVTYTEYENWTPENANREYGGVYSMEGALSHSVNAVTVGIMMRAGVDSVRQLARAIGIPGPIPDGPAIALGAVDASLMDMVRVYGTFANRGRRPDLHYLDRIETSDGETIAKFERPNPRRFPRIIKPEHADMMISMLESVVDSGTARRLKYEYRLYNDIAGKTGTTQKQTDGWFLGFTPNIVAGVWVGADNPSVRFRSMRLGQGSNTALPIWGRFMRKVYNDPQLKKLKYAKFSEPNDTIRALMQCPPFLEEMPILAEYWNDYQQDPAFFNRLMTDLADERHQDIMIQLKDRRRNETDAEYYERMRRYNERLQRQDERRENLKNFWSDVLFGKKKKDDKKEGQ